MTGRVVNRAYRYRFSPTPGQETELRRTFGCVRKVYNLALQARTAAGTQEQRRVTGRAVLACGDGARPTRR